MTDIFASRFAIDAILTRIEKMMAEIPGVIASEDPEYLHRMRVAARRLRTALQLLGGMSGLSDGRAFFKLARSTGRMLGRARDLDVQIIWLGEFGQSCAKNERPGVERLVLRLKQDREKLQQGIVDLLSDLAENRVVGETTRKLREIRIDMEMKGGGGNDFDIGQASRTISLLAESLLQHSTSLASANAADAQHRMRIEAKRLRYAMEIYRDLYAGPIGGLSEHDGPPEKNELDRCIDTAKKLQGMLGDLHDADVWIAEIPRLIERERKLTERYFGTARPFCRLLAGYNAVTKDRQAFRDVCYERTVEFWMTTVGEKRWERLRAFLLASCRGDVA
jgi:CHAD domain-containing protein